MTLAASCPDCRVPMHLVSARARTGYLLSLDQCGDCGGVWFDRWELFPLHHEEVKRLDPVDGDLLQDALAAGIGGDARRARDCPRCEIALRDFRDVNLPADAEVARCLVCEGMWLQRGQLRAVKKQAPRLDAGNRSDEAAALAALAKAYENEAHWSRIDNLDRATYETEEPPPDLETAGDAVKSALPWLILQVLFRLLLRR